MADLPPGVTKRRWIPDVGERKHREKIHRESKLTDNYKNLPYSFSKPVKHTKCSYFECEECGNVVHVGKNCIMMICSKCKQLVKVKELK